jgi:putative NADPH-quinone reductase
MRVLYLYCHPLDDSFHAALRGVALDGLARAGHTIDLVDLYADGFDPVLSADGRRRYHDTSRNREGIERYAERLLAAEGLVVQFPVWSFGPPAMLKGFMDRLFMPGVGFDISDPANVRRLLQYRRLAGITTYGRPWSRALAVGDPPRKWVTRYLRLMGKGWVRTDYLALYHMNVADAQRRGAFLEKVGRAMAKF